MDISEEMIRIVLDQYQSSFQCVEKVIRFLNKVDNVKPPLEEEVYLTMHIEKIRQMKM
ncbi:MULTISPECIES: PRD domain-containing protein [Enterococcus]|nr:hypothetical protein RV03_GL001571 [Enterococcus gallinarum]